MIIPFSEYEPPSYKKYHNQTVKKHIAKMENQLRQIKECSLKPAHKEALKAKLLELLTEQMQKP